MLKKIDQVRNKSFMATKAVKEKEKATKQKLKSVKGQVKEIEKL